MDSLPSKIVRKLRVDGRQCEIIKLEVRSLSDYVAAFSSVIRPGELFWFRGHNDFTYRPAPSALRFKDPAKRERALKLIADFKRFAEFKLDKPPDASEELKWIQLAQHFGLPTRLLDWTQNAAVALYFACQNPDQHGAVLVLNPVT